MPASYALRRIRTASGISTRCSGRTPKAVRDTVNPVRPSHVERLAPIVLLHTVREDVHMYVVVADVAEDDGLQVARLEAGIIHCDGRLQLLVGHGHIRPELGQVRAVTFAL